MRLQIHVGRLRSVSRVNTVKFLNFQTSENFAENSLKLKCLRPNHLVICLKDAKTMANSENPDQTAPLIWVCTVCPELFVLKLRIITVTLSQKLVTQLP